MLLRCSQSPSIAPCHFKETTPLHLLLLYFCSARSNQHKIWAAGGKSVFIWEAGWEEPFKNKSTFGCFRNLEILHGHPMQSDPKQKIKYTGETRHRTQPPQIHEQYFWWCADFWDQAPDPHCRFPYIFILQVGCCVSLHRSGSAEHKTHVYTICVFPFLSFYNKHCSQMLQCFYIHSLAVARFD